MQKIVLLAAATALVAIGAWYVLPGVNGTDETPVAEGAPLVSVTLPENLSETAQIGAKIFEAKCAACHGTSAGGRNGFGPPLIHQYYVPSHHGDEAFQRAAALGVKSHHWRFGDMPPVNGITRAEVSAIIEYIRQVQRANGIG